MEQVAHQGAGEFGVDGALREKRMRAIVKNKQVGQVGVNLDSVGTVKSHGDIPGVVPSLDCETQDFGLRFHRRSFPFLLGCVVPSCRGVRNIAVTESGPKPERRSGLEPGR